MSQDVIHCGIDVDGGRCHACALNPCTGESLEFRPRPALKALVGRLEKLGRHLGSGHLKPCYEASYVGFPLQRDLRGRGFDREVVAPTSIARRPGKAVKTDRIDAADLAQYHSTGLFTVVATPEPVCVRHGGVSTQ